MTVSELKQRMSGREFFRWIAYSVIEPWGEERADLRAAMIASTIANVNRGKGRPVVPIERFMPKFGPKQPAKKQSVQDMMATFKRHTTAAR